jgi:ATP-binding cassette subfamily B protein
MRQNRTELPASNRNDWDTIRSLLPYLWQFKGRIGIALAFLILAKLANIGVPVALKHIVDALDRGSGQALAVGLPLALLIGYGLLRLGTNLFNELRNAVFARASQRSIREIALKVFKHLHALTLRFHLDRQTGGLSRDLERGTRSISQLLHYLVFSILPTFFEVAVVIGILLVNYDPSFALITLATVVLYVVYTVLVTNWRTKFRVWMNRADSNANSRAIDSLINYETVKYFGNEEHEARHYDERLQEWERASVKSQTSLALLNIGQGIIIASGLTLLLVLAGQGVVAGTMTLGDFVMVNAFLIQLYIPLNFLGSIFREVKHCLTDVERMFNLMDESPEVVERPDAPALDVGDGNVAFEHVDFGYRHERKVLHDVSFRIRPGSKVAVVGTSGAGKSTLARLLFRFYDVNDGRITINGHDIRDVTLDSLRAAIGIVPQDTVLFNDTVYYNILYGRPDASREEVVEAARLAHIHDFVMSLPDGYETVVGERGLKLSGGEKQRVAIARTVLKRPKILIFDEATSALDSRSEKSILAALAEVAANHTTLAIAHRLSTVVDSDEIIVLEHGRVVERGTHQDLVRRGGVYAHMWTLQQEERRVNAERGLQPPQAVAEPR